MYFYRVYSPCSLTYSIIPKYILIVINRNQYDFSDRKSQIHLHIWNVHALAISHRYALISRVRTLIVFVHIPHNRFDTFRRSIRVVNVPFFTMCVAIDSNSRFVIFVLQWFFVLLWCPLNLCNNVGFQISPRYAWKQSNLSRKKVKSDAVGLSPSRTKTIWI